MMQRRCLHNKVDNINLLLSFALSLLQHTRKYLPAHALISCLLVSFSVSAQNGQAMSPENLNTPSINIAYLHQHIVDQQLKVNSQILFTLPKDMLKALRHEIPLTFNIELQLLEKHNFWGISYTRTRQSIRYQTQLSYNTYDKTYVISNTRNTEHQSFKNLHNALRTFGTVQNFTLANLANLHSSTDYVIAFKVSFNRWALPTPLLIEAFTHPRWHLSSNWHSIDLHSPKNWTQPRP